MIINNKKLLVFPEYHLTDFPPQVTMSQDEARNTLIMYKKYGFDVLIAGYIEVDDGNLYSSCLIIDDSITFNIRKRYPFKEETKIISPWLEDNHSIELSIGRSFFLLCNDLIARLKEQYNMNGVENIENLFLISAMFNKFNENVEAGIDYCIKHNIKRFITADRFNGVNQQVLENIA